MKPNFPKVAVNLNFNVDVVQALVWIIAILVVLFS